MQLRLGRRVATGQAWLEQRADSAFGRLSLQWFRSYFAASENSASAATLYATLSMAPIVLAGIGVFGAVGGNTNAFAERLIDHLNLHGSTARLVQDTFGTASQNAVAASLAAVIGFFIWGIGIGQIYQDLYARTWGVRVSAAVADQLRFTIWFFVVSALLGGYILFAAQVRAAGWPVALPIWLVASTVFWLWTPWFLLRGQIPLPHVLPGALLASVVIGGANVVSPLFLGGWLNADGQYFGPFGVVIALLGWAFVMVALSMVCIVFSAVWRVWRENEKERSLAVGRASTDP